MRKSESPSEACVRIRSELGLTQVLLAEKLGVASNYIYLIESGKKKPSEKLVRKLESLVRYPESSESIMKLKEGMDPYRTRKTLWNEACNIKLEELLIEYAGEKDWGAVKEITSELLNRKITDKLKGKLP